MHPSPWRRCHPAAAPIHPSATQVDRPPRIAAGPCRPSPRPFPPITPTPPVYSGAAVQVIHGPVSGDSQLAQIQMDPQPCNILAEDPRSVMRAENPISGCPKPALSLSKGSTSGRQSPVYRGVTLSLPQPPTSFRRAAPLSIVILTRRLPQNLRICLPWHLAPGTWHPAPNTPAFAFPSSNARPGGSRGLVAQGFSPRP